MLIGNHSTPPSRKVAFFAVIVASLAMMTIVAAPACARTDTNTNNNGDGPASANVYAIGICNRFAKCAPSFVRSQFTDVATCTDAVTQEATKLLSANGTSIKKRQLDACLIKTESAPCNVDIETIAECDFKGTLANGAPCASGVQCASGSCFKQSSAPFDCGQCSMRVGADQNCSSVACEPGLQCIPGGNCARPGEENAPCGDRTTNAACRATLECVNGFCASTHAREDPCDDDAGVVCSSSQGLVCVNGNCAAPLAKMGSSCVTKPYCEGSFCSPATKSCTAWAGEGADCSATTFCAFPFDCRAGKCARAAEPASCQ